MGASGASDSGSNPDGSANHPQRGILRVPSTASCRLFQVPVISARLPYRIPGWNHQPIRFIARERLIANMTKGRIPPRAELAGLPKTVHGGQAWKLNDVEDYSHNLNPFGPPEDLADIVASAIGSVGHYPDDSCAELKDVISKAFNIGADCITDHQERPQHVLHQQRQGRHTDPLLRRVHPAVQDRRRPRGQPAPLRR